MKAVLKRLKVFIKHLDMNNYSFEVAVGLSKNVIQKPMLNGTSFTITTLLKIANVFPELDMNWLLTGSGEMLQKNNSAKPSKLLPRYKSIAELEQQFVVLQGYLIDCMKENKELGKQTIRKK